MKDAAKIGNIPVVNPWMLLAVGGAVWLLSSAWIVAAFRGLLPPKEWQDVYGFLEKTSLAFCLLAFIWHLGVSIRDTLAVWWRDRAAHLRIILRYFGVYFGALLAVVTVLLAIFLALEKSGHIDYATILTMAEEPDSVDKTSRLRLLLMISQPRFFLSLFATCVIAPIIEEVFFRRLFFGALRERMTFAPALLLSTVAFMTVHQNIALGAIGGLYLGYVYEKGRSLPANIVIHMMANATVTGISLAL